MKVSKKWLVAFCTLCMLASFAGCTRTTKDVEPQGMAYFTYFDTVSYVYSYAGDSAERFQERSAEVSSVLYEYHQLFDIYHEYAGVNNLATVNRLAGGEPIAVDEKLVDFLLYARELFELTHGEMNVMMGSVLRIWHDYRTEGKAVPPQELLEEAAKHTDFSLLEIDEEKNTVRITDKLASIDVGALGKGYATEMAAQQLEAQGVTSYVLNIGGNIRIIGNKPNGDGWVTGIKDPEKISSYAMKLTLSDTSCVTSGDYERYVEVDGIKYHHVIDKDTLMPANHFRSVTVVCRDSALADALSTALFCMNYEDGKSLVQSMQGVEAVWICPGGEIYATEGIEALSVK